MSKACANALKKTPVQLFTLHSSLFTSQGFSSLAAVAVIGLILAVFLGLVGTGAIRLPGNTKIPTSPIPLSDPVEDDEACNDPYNADCENETHDPEDLTSEEIQKALKNY